MGIVGLLLAVLFGLNPLGGGGSGSPTQSVGAPGAADVSSCRTGADANERLDCRIVGVVNSVQRFWTDTRAAQRRPYEPAVTRLFTGSTSTGCGPATSD